MLEKELIATIFCYLTEAFTSIKNSIYMGTTAKSWRDKLGKQVPFDRIKKSERLSERRANTLAREAMSIAKKLADFHAKFGKYTQEIHNVKCYEKHADPTLGKGNRTWYNFDKSFKFEINVYNVLTFDEDLLKEAQDRLDEFLNQHLQTANQLMIELIKDTFTMRSGKLDVRKVLSLTKYKDKLNDPLYSEAMDLLEEATKIEGQRSYYRFWKLNPMGHYEPIKLNLSAIE